MNAPLTFPALALAALSTLGPLAGCSHDGTPGQPPATGGTTTAATAPAAEPTPTPATTTAPTAAAPTTTAPATPGDLAVGSPAPDFDLHASDGTALSSQALKGKSIVLYFYPKDETPGCTTEACSFRDAWAALSKTGVVLIGVSADTDESHRDFAAHHKLPFYLVSDPQGSLAAKFGVPVQNGYESRQSFLIGPDGKLKKVYRHVDVTVHAAQIANDLK